MKVPLTIRLDNDMGRCYTTNMTDTTIIYDIKNRVFFGEWCRNTMGSGKHGCLLGLLKRTGAPRSQRRRVARKMAESINPKYPRFLPAAPYVAVWNDKQDSRWDVDKMLDKVVVRQMFEHGTTAEGQPLRELMRM